MSKPDYSRSRQQDALVQMKRDKGQMGAPIMHNVQSSSIVSLGHNPVTETMRVLFRNGGLYEHSGVTAEQFATLRSAKSIGAHYSKHHGKTGKRVKR